MDDLAGLNWSSAPAQAKPPPAAPSNANYFPTLKPTPPTSGRSTPAPAGKASSTGASKTATPANDSFANLVPFGSSSQPAKQLSLQEQQKALHEQRAKSLGLQSQQWTGSSGFGSGRSTPARTMSPALSGNATSTTQPPSRPAVRSDEADLLAGFAADAPVDRSTHFPPPLSRSTSTGPPADAYAGLDDDDPFGLGTGPAAAPSASATATAAADDDDDVLGLLGKPVSEIPRPKQKEPEPEPVTDPRDKAIAEIVDMGFPAEKAARALAQTDSGTDVQAAVGLLLKQAHAASSRTRDGSAGPREATGRSSSAQRAAADERDAAKVASEIGNNLFKTANSLWKSGQKRFNKAVADFNADSDPTQPKWMREAEAAARPKPRTKADMTDEAMMLEAGSGRPPRKTETPPPPRQPARPSRRVVEEESAQAYISPARRKKAAAQPQPPPEEPDLLFGGAPAAASSALPSRAPPKPAATASVKAPAKPAKAPAARRPATPPRPKAPPRTIPHLSSIALQSSTAHRLKGNAAFKLGNYGDATAAYTLAFRDIPDTHPLAILLLTNRALTNLKTGDPKAAIADADAAIAVIGPSRGQDETIDAGDEGTKPMGPFWGKAMMRRAEALEQLERWADAAKAWTDCVQAGVGGAQSIQARNRCERALAPKAAPKPAAKPKPRAVPKPRSAMQDLEATSGAAVNRLRAANAAAEKADDERFALADAVDERLTKWRKGKEGNLRALLGSLDTVLWEGAGWKKVGMSELIVPGKVKVAYMKGIAKVHPDKLSPGASTEQVMISGAVFATLNEAWDRFKVENGL